jgi:signal transduction histidine kinase/ligand-binding sensor domain-containing protein/CheY-like chemotaxis protein
MCPRAGKTRRRSTMIREPAFAVSLLTFAMALPVPGLAALDPHKAITQYVERIWNVDSGLPQASVRAIAQTHDGYLWIGTEDGLVRFDGVRFVVFDTRNTRELKSNEITALLAGLGNDLWIGTDGGGLSHLEEGKFTNYTAGSGISSDAILSLYRDRFGALWIGTDGGGLDRFADGQFRVYDRQDGMPDATVFSICGAADGGLWLGMRSGLVHFKDGAVRRYTTEDGLPSNEVHAVYRAHDGSLWVGSNRGLGRFVNGHFQTYTERTGLPSNLILSLREDAAGALWMGTGDAGVARYYRGKFSSYGPKQGFVSDVVFTTFEDQEGNLWIGTGAGGLVRLRDGSFTTITSREGLSSDPILGVFEDREGAIWAGTFGTGVDRIQNGKVRVFSQRDGLSSNKIFSIAQDASGDIWFGTRDGGLDRYHAGRIIVYRRKDGIPSDFVACLYVDHNGTLWVGTRGGLSRFDGKRFYTYTSRDGLSSDFVLSLYQDSQGALWVGTHGGGLNRFQNGRFTSFTTRNGLSNNVVMSITGDPDGTLWIATNGGGLDRFRNGKFVNYSSRNGLYEDGILSMIDDGLGYLWLTSDRGIFRVSKRALNEFAEHRIHWIEPRAFDLSDGLKSLDCNGAFQPSCWRGRDGQLYFPTMKGLSIVDPAHLAEESAAPRVVIERVVADSKSYNPSGLIRLPPGEGRLEFDFTALSFAAPERVRFRYQLRGFDRNWVEAGTRRVAYYTNIPPGKYTFQVAAANGSGIWNHLGASVSLRLQPHFYQSYSFALFCVLAMFGLAYGAYRIRMQRVRAHEAKLIALVNERTYALEQHEAALRRSRDELAARVLELKAENLERRRAQQELKVAKEQAEAANRAKSEFLANISHEVRTPLNGIIGMVQLALESELTPEQRQCLELAASSADLLLSIINDLLDFSKIEAGKLELEAVEFGLRRHLDRTLKSLGVRAAQKGVELICNISPRVPERLIGDPIRLTQILVNLIGNAIKFTERGFVLVRIELERRDVEAVYLRFLVSDTGIGIPRERQSAIFEAFTQADGSFTRKYGGTGLGLTISSKLAALMGSTIWVESDLGKGSTFGFTLKLRLRAQGCGMETDEVLTVKPALEGKIVLVVARLGNLELLEELLADWGAQVILAQDSTTAQEALLKCDQAAAFPELVLIDADLPQEGGFALAQAMRSAWPDLAIVMMLNPASTFASASHCRALGIASRLIKPISVFSLAEAINQALASGRSEFAFGESEKSSCCASTGGLRILLVEDNPINCMVARRLLEKQGHTVIAAHNGREAIQQVEDLNWQIDLVFMDVQMPEMDGLETTLMLREKERRRGGHLPIIAMTAHAFDRDRERCLEAGMDDYIAKPIQPEQLYELIERVTGAAATLHR